MGRSSVSLPRVGSDGEARRVLRLRVDAKVLARFRAPSPGDAAALVVPSREPVAVGEPVRVELSFGPLADEVIMEGSVRSVRTTEPGRPAEVTIGLPAREALRIRYVRQVWAGDRPASARRDRRVAVDLEVLWTWQRSQYASRLRDLSRGGAFVASRWLPSVGAPVQMVLRPRERDEISLDAVVTWVRREGDDPGFGVCFQIPNRAAATRLTQVVRTVEAAHVAVR